MIPSAASLGVGLRAGPATIPTVGLAARVGAPRA